MPTTPLSRSLLGALALVAMPVPAMAQTAPDATTQALRDEVAALKSRLEALERRLSETAPAQAPATPVSAAPAVAATTAPATPPAAAASDTRIEWKGSPRFVSGDRSFKVKGRLQADLNYVSTPAGMTDRGLGMSNEFRRIRLGGEGELGKGFGYKLELELSDNSVDLVDAFMTYRRGHWLVTLGNHNQFQSLDELTGDTSGTVMERAAFTDAFAFERRLGLSAQYTRGPVLAQLGLFTDDITALANSSDGPAGGDENNSFSVDGRLVYAPVVDGVKLHLGASGHWRRLGRLAAAPTRYRQRPFVHSSNSRLISTSAMLVREETSHGLELAAISGPWHGVVEGHWLHAARMGTAATALLGDPNFRGGYAEIGYFLTDGDSTAYSGGIFGSTRPRKPLGQGGIGAIQANLRYDALDMNSKDVRGGTQKAYIAALVWTPIQNLRFNLNYAYIRYTDALATSDGRTAYGIHAVGSRFELDF